ncbi:MAG: InlB B-repeat-containing protein [Acholeplasmataceae bacterium]|nr:InlB B-repeat-containing protein [Acholeplasmataceae bacterium]
MRIFKGLLAVFGIVFSFFLFTPIEAKTKVEYLEDYEAMSFVDKINELVNEIPAQSQIYYNTLSVEGKALYNAYLDHIKLGTLEVPFVINYENITQAEMDIHQQSIIQAYLVLIREHSELFFLNGGLERITRTTTSPDPKDFEVELTFNLTDSYISNGDVDYEKLEVDLNMVLASRDFISQAVQTLSIEYEKYKYIHDYLVLNNSYLKTNDLSHTPVGALVDWETPVCEAYAEAFQLLAHHNGLNSTYVTGKIISNGELHAWNNVKLGGTWYFIDVTWDDPISADLDYIGYDYFLTPQLPSSERLIDEEVITPTPFTTAVYDNIPVYEIKIYIDGELANMQMVTSGGDVVVPTSLKREGYDLVFDLESTRINSDRSLNGTYVLQTFTITFKTGSTIIKTETVDYNVTPVAPEDPIRPNHTFLGWNMDIEPAKEDRVYEAQYRLNSDINTEGNTLGTATGLAITLGIGLIAIVGLMILFKVLGKIFR